MVLVGVGKPGRECDAVGMSLRSANIARMRGGVFDVLIVGAGINGAVSAAALAGRGASVALIDRGDFGAFTSQESSNLVWGGFKYLENYELPLVFGLCRSRNRLMKAYPDNIREIRFLASLDETAPFRPWFAALGAAAYWVIGQFGTKPPKQLDPARINDEEPAIRTDSVRGGIEYRDAYSHRQRLAIRVLVRPLRHRGRCERRQLRRVGERRNASGAAGSPACATSTAARSSPPPPARSSTSAGPFVDELNGAWRLTTGHRIVYSKGIHLVVPRINRGRRDRVLAFFDDTQRLFYVIPMGRRSVIGTTDTRVETPFTEVDDDDRAFLLDQINARLDLDEPITVDDIIAERSGVRPLVVKAGAGDQRDVEWTSLSRKHEIERDDDLAVVTIFGGKLTDCLNVGEEVCDEIEELGVAARARPPPELVRRTGRGDAQGVLPAGPAHEARRAALEARHRAAHRSSLAALRPPGVRSARGDPRRPGDGRGHHGVGRLPASRTAHCGPSTR